MIKIRKSNTEIKNKRNKVKQTNSASRVFIPKYDSKKLRITGKIYKEKNEERSFLNKEKHEKEQKTKPTKPIKDTTAVSGGCFFFQNTFMPGIVYSTFALISYMRKSILKEKNKEDVYGSTLKKPAVPDGQDLSADWRRNSSKVGDEFKKKYFHNIYSRMGGGDNAGVRL